MKLILTVKSDSKTHISILHVSINDSEYIIVNLYNVNTEKEQINALRNLLELLEIV